LWTFTSGQQFPIKLTCPFAGVYVGEVQKNPDGSAGNCVSEIMQTPPVAMPPTTMDVCPG
jgi:hypothetical protein